MRLFAQSFSGDVKKWFKGLTTGIIHDFQEFEAVFFKRMGTQEKLITTLNTI